MSKLETSPTTHAWNVSSVLEPGAFDLYRQGMADLYEIDDVAFGADRGFINQSAVTLFESGTIGYGRSAPQTLRRTPVQIRRSNVDSISLILNRSDLTGDCDGRDVRSAPGAIQFRDLARPSVSRLDRVDVVNMMIPREKAPMWMLEGQLHGLVLPAGSAMYRLLAGHLSTLAEVAPGLTNAEGEAGIEAALLIAGRGIGRLDPVTQDQTEAVYRTVRVRASLVIERRLLDPTLTTSTIAVETGASRSTLYRAFADYGGVHKRIQTLRLGRARDALRRRVGRHPTVAAVAFQHGFASEAHFSRAFRHRFGHAPSDAGAAAAERSIGLPQRNPAFRYDAWMDWLRRPSAA